MRVVSTEKIPIKLWLDDIEPEAMRQAQNLANLPFAYKWVAIMPDSHVGYGMPIGGVLATNGVVVPNAVGVDIGCGMSVVETSITSWNTDQIKRVMGKIRESIPVGFNHHKTERPWDGFREAPDIDIIDQEIKHAKYQLGTLGGGNHFIELQKSTETGRLHVMIHSGSRNFGLKIAKEYHERAKLLCEQWYSNIPDPDLAFFPIDSEDGHEYLAAMNFALRFAKENRGRMMDAIKVAILYEFSAETKFPFELDIHHNYAAMEHHHGKNVCVHRKGATKAMAGQLGIIPGSQGSKSYIVEGLGNPESFMSCSHGAGRRLGRKQAQRELSLEAEKKRLDDIGVIHAIRNAEDLDEAPSAYKDIDTVMENQKDLVKIHTELTPIAVIKA